MSSIPVGPVGPPSSEPTEAFDQKRRELDEEIVSLAKKANLLQASAEKLRKAPSIEKDSILVEAQRLHGMPQSFTEKEAVQFIDHALGEVLSNLSNSRAMRAALEPRCLSLLEKQIVDLAGADLEKTRRYRAALEYRDLALSTLRRLYFETQGGPTRRRGCNPGDVAMTLAALDGSSGSYMLASFWKNLTEFYEQLSPEDTLKYEPVCRSFFEKLKTALPLFDLESSHNSEELMREAASQIRSLKEGESILLPGGGLSHAIVYEVKKEGPDAYSFRIFNSGAGLETHHGGRGGKYSNVLIRNIPASKLEEAFFKRLYLPDAESDPYLLFETLGPLEFDESFRYDQGGIGSCSYQSILRWAKTQMEPELYRQVREFTLRALIEDCRCRFGGLVRPDGSIRSFKPVLPAAGGPEVAEARALPEGFDADSAAKLIEFAERSVQKVSRNSFIDGAVKRASAISDEQERRAAFLAIIDDEKIRATILDHQDRCLVLLRIAGAIFLQKGGFLEEVGQTIDEQISKELELIQDPERRAATEFKIAEASLTQGKVEEALIHIERSLQLIKERRGASSTFLMGRIRETLVMEARTLGSPGGKKASQSLGAISQVLISLGDAKGAREALEKISDPEERENEVFAVLDTFADEVEEASICGRTEEAKTLLNQAADLMELANASQNKLIILCSLARGLAFRKAQEEETKKVLNQVVETATLLRDVPIPCDQGAVLTALEGLYQMLAAEAPSLAADLAEIIPDASP